jgi:outer membrane protein with beta-barrel domain
MQMQKLLTTSLLLFICFGLAAQNKVTGGLRIGTNYTDFKFDSQNAGSGQFGYNGGLFVRTGKQLFLQSGIDFLTIKNEWQPVGQPKPGNVNHSFLILPVLAGYKAFLSDDEAMAIRFSGGMSYSYLVSLGNNRLNLAITDMNRSMFNLQFELGLELWLLTFDINYIHGLSNVISGNTSKMRAVVLTIGATLF